MAHIIHLPISFEYRRASIQWTEIFGQVTGWRRTHETHGAPDGQYLTANIASTGQKLPFALSRLAEDKRQQCVVALSEDGSDEAVKQICSDVLPSFFVHTIATHIEPSELIKHTQISDAWQMREDFLRMKPSSEAAISFLNEWGRWRPFRRNVDLTEMLRLQSAVRDALTVSRENWLASQYAFPTITGARSKTYPYFEMITDCCQIAIRMATTIDCVQQLAFKTCARPDCGVPFPVESKHPRRYCRQYCAHLESVRRNRKPKIGKSGQVRE